MSANALTVSFEELDRWLARTPVIGHVHPLTPLCLRPGTHIITDTQSLLSKLDIQKTCDVEPWLILSQDFALLSRFPLLRSLDHPPVETINTYMAQNLSYARTHLLTIHKVASYITRDVAHHTPDVVILFLVDGLSYGDVVDWPCDLQPCFVDGPSITYRFLDNANKTLNKEVGFAAIINRPSIYHRLYQLGYRHARGYTYWNRNNVVADYMFTGVPYEHIANVETALHLLEAAEIPHRSYVQIVREGLDGLAHGKRELRQAEIQVAIQAILHDVERLMDVFQRKNLSARIFLTADHGILWKAEHPFQIVRGSSDHKPRYATSRPHERLNEHAVRVESDGVPYYLFMYPYLGSKIRANDSGVHGGLSYQESIVPFAKFKV